jgi:hypothetical protein
MTEEERRKRDNAERQLMEKFSNARKSERSIKQREERHRKREEKRNRNK